MSHLDNRLLFTGEDAIDLSMVFEICGDDKKDVVRLMSTFLHNIPTTVDQLSSFFQTGDQKQLYQSAHAARSPLSIIKIPVLYNYLLKIEQLISQKNNDAELKPLIKQVQLIYLQVQQKLTAWLKD